MEAAAIFENLTLWLLRLMEKEQYSSFKWEVVGMSGNKRINEKGFLLFEAILSWVLITTCLMIYLPILVNLLTTLHSAKNELEMARIGYEQIQKSVETEIVDDEWETNGKIYTISEKVVNGRKGIWVYEEGKVWNLQMESLELLSSRP